MDEIQIDIKLIGITGGIAAGKSLVANETLSFKGNLEKQSDRIIMIEVINCDLLGHKTYEDENTECFKEIVHHFGKGVVTMVEDNQSGNGTTIKQQINRKELGKIVFSDKSKLQLLSHIVWPHLKNLLVQMIDEFKQNVQSVARDIKEKKEAKVKKIMGFYFIEAAILFEAGFDSLCDVIWTINCDREVAIARLQVRNSLSRQEAEQRIDSQMSNEDRAKRSDAVIINNYQQIEPLRSQVFSLLRQLVSS